MSSRFTSWVVAAITTLLITSLPVLGSVSAASAVPGDPIIPTSPSCVVQLVTGDPATAPPAPTCYDPSGSDLDEFLVPHYVDASGRRVLYVDQNMNMYWNDRPNSTKGASQVSVQSQHYDPSVGMYVNGHAWVLGFNTAVTAAAGSESYWVTVGGCLGNDKIRQATAYFRNEPSDGRYVGYVYPQATHDGGDALDTQPALRVYEGSTVGIPLVSSAYMGAGLVSGHIYTVKYWFEDRNSLQGSGAGTRRLGGQVTVEVPDCKIATQDPVGVAPQAKIVVLKRGPAYSQVKVVLGSRTATVPTRYQVIRDPRWGLTVRKTYLSKYKVVRYYKVKRGTVIKVRFKTVLARRRV